MMLSKLRSIRSTLKVKETLAWEYQIENQNYKECLSENILNQEPQVYIGNPMEYYYDREFEFIGKLKNNSLSIRFKKSKYLDFISDLVFCKVTFIQNKRTLSISTNYFITVAAYIPYVFIPFALFSFGFSGLNLWYAIPFGILAMALYQMSLCYVKKDLINYLKKLFESCIGERLN